MCVREIDFFTMRNPVEFNQLEYDLESAEVSPVKCAVCINGKWSTGMTSEAESSVCFTLHAAILFI